MDVIYKEIWWTQTGAPVDCLEGFCGAAFGSTAAMMSEDALEEREHARQGHPLDDETAINVDGTGSKKKVIKPNTQISKLRKTYSV